MIVGCREASYAAAAGAPGIREHSQNGGAAKLERVPANRRPTEALSETAGITSVLSRDAATRQEPVTSPGHPAERGR